MRKETVVAEGLELDVYSLNTVIVGSGAAGFNAADSLWELGQKDIALVTEGIYMGTSRNTGSDKQTYYKLSLASDAPDSVMEMATTLYEGGCMHGDIALVEAALSARSFFKLAAIGVPFPHNEYGEYVGYKTDHDPRNRATSAGPLTSRYMTERLEKQVLNKGIKIFDGFRVIGIITAEASPNGERKSIGLIALDKARLHEKNMGITLFNCTNIIYAVGGPAGIYLDSVYPESQTGATGIALEAGAAGINLTESQYGLASLKFRWNLSGTYQQVIPRYISTEQDGSDEREFLDEFFDTPGHLLDAIFLKGYQWPFDPRKVENYGSSLIDILVYHETQIKGRRVYLDYTKNLSQASINGEMDFSLLGEEAKAYLKKSGALFGAPLDRLKKMNPLAIDLYRRNGIDLEKEYLEIGVCAQHNNGGLKGNIWWESNLLHFFPVGEVNGTFGVYRPGGSALNSTQVGSFRAAQYIKARYPEEPLDTGEFIRFASSELSNVRMRAGRFLEKQAGSSNVQELRKRYQARMTHYGAHIRSMEGCLTGIHEILQDLERFDDETCIASPYELPEVFINRDILLTQFTYLCAIKEYIAKGGKSRGSYLIQDHEGKRVSSKLPEIFRYSTGNDELKHRVCELQLKVKGSDISCTAEWKPVRPIPEPERWFENVWEKYRNEEIYKR